MDSLQACKIVFPSSTPLIGACKTSVYNLNSSSVYYNQQCCYNDQNQIAGGNPDITTKGVATSLHDLVNSENWSKIIYHFLLSCIYYTETSKLAQQYCKIIIKGIKKIQLIQMMV